MKKTISIINNIASWLFLIIMFAFLILAGRAFYISKTTGESAYVLNHRFIYITSGSMEPTMKTNSLALSKKVNSMEDLETGDIISFTLYNNDQILRTTHRIYDIDEEGNITTKGDNNSVIDAYPITIQNVESKVVHTFNFIATLQDYWKGGFKNKVFMVSGGIIILCGLLFLDTIFKEKKKKKKDTNKENDDKEDAENTEE